MITVKSERLKENVLKFLNLKKETMYVFLFILVSFSFVLFWFVYFYFLLNYFIISFRRLIVF